VDFNQGILCSHPDLEDSGINCIKESSTGCIEGRDEIYWFDSCGNRENIYGTSYDGTIKNKEESCSPSFPNIDSRTCGNCDRISTEGGSVCSETSSTSIHINDGNYVCKDIDCHASEKTLGIKRKNGESWCIYDSFVGSNDEFSIDVIGGEHWKGECINGEVKVDRCGEYRGYVCGEGHEGTENKKISKAQCRPNLWYNCFLQTKKEECEQIPDCRWHSVDVDSSFNFDACVPKYPKGFDSTSSEEKRNGKDICEIATQTCTVPYKKYLDFRCGGGGLFGIGGGCSLQIRWKCEANCECETEKFSQEMNNFCISLGDCGGYVNIEGEYVKNFEVSMRVEHDDIKSHDRGEGYVNGLSQSYIDRYVSESVLTEVKKDQQKMQL